MGERERPEPGVGTVMPRDNNDVQVVTNQPVGGPAPGFAGLVSSEGALEPELQAHIGRQLRAMYNEVVNEPVPDRLLLLLQDLERKQAGK